jgi:uncharacterized membrane protein
VSQGKKPAKPPGKNEPPNKTEADIERAVEVLATADEAVTGEFLERNPKLASVVIRRFFMGPLPSPEVLKAYRDAGGEDCVQRILKGADEERAHRHSMNRHHFYKSYAGLAAAVLVSFGAFATSVWLTSMGNNWGATVVVGVALVNLVSALLDRKKEGKKSS